MAKFNVVGLDDVQEAMLRQDAIVEEAVPEMLKAGGAVMQKAQQEEIKTRDCQSRFKPCIRYGWYSGYRSLQSIPS